MRAHGRDRIAVAAVCLGALLSCSARAAAAETGGIESVIGRLSSPDAAEREAAIDDLNAFRAATKKQAVPALAKALRDESMDVRISAYVQLQFLGPDAAAAVPALIEVLRSREEDDAFYREAAIDVLREIGPAAQAAIPELRSAATEAQGDGDLRQKAVDALRAMGEPGSQALAAMSAESSDGDLQRDVTRALGKTGAAAVPALATKLRDVDPEVRKEAVAGLVAIGPPSVRAGVSALEDPSLHTRLAAAFVLRDVATSDPARTSALERALDDPDDAVRLVAAEGLLAGGDRRPRVVAILFASLDSRFPDVRNKSAQLIGQLGDRDTPELARLIARKNDPDRRTRRAVVSALRELGELKETIAVYAQALGSADADESAEASEALESLGTDGVPGFATALDDPRASARLAAARGLARLGASAGLAVPALRRRLQDPDDLVRITSAAALAAAGEERDREMVTPVLLAALRDSGDKDLRLLTLEALASLDEERWSQAARTDLELLLADSDPEIAASAARLVATSHAAAAGLVPALAKAGGADAEEVRIAAFDALGRAGEAAAPAVSVLLEGLRRGGDERAPAGKALAAIGAPAVRELLALAEDPDQSRARAALRVFALMDRAAIDGAIPLLAPRLASDPRPVVRIALAEVLALAGGAAPAALRKAATADADPEVRIAATTALAGRAPISPDSFEALKSATRDADPGVRRAALGAIGSAGSRAVPLLRDALQDPEPMVRERAAFDLGIAYGEIDVAVQALSGVLEDDDPDVRRTAAEGIANMAPYSQPAVTALLGALAHPDEGVAAIAATGLGSAANGASVTGALVRSAEDPRSDVRRGVATALGRIGKPAAEHAPALVPLLSDADAGVRERAAEALGRIGPLPELACGALAGTLGDPEADVKLATVRALGRIGDCARVPLRTSLSDRDLRVAAALALLQVGDTDTSIPVLREALRSPDDEAREETLEAIAALDAPPAELAPEIEAALADRIVAVRFAAAATLARLGKPIGLDTLQRGLADPDLETRRVAAVGLEMVGPGAAPALPSLLAVATEAKASSAEEAWLVLGWSLRALGAIGPQASAAVPLMADSLRDERSFVAESSASALAKMGPTAREAVPALEEALWSPSVDVRSDAMRALVAIQGAPRAPGD